MIVFLPLFGFLEGRKENCTSLCVVVVVGMRKGSIFSHQSLFCSILLHSIYDLLVAHIFHLFIEMLYLFNPLASVFHDDRICAYSCCYYSDI